MPVPSLDRRRLLGLGAAGALAAGTGFAASPRAWSSTGTDPFTLGVASGDPLPDGVVLWTRLTRDPLAPDGLGGMGGRAVTVGWQVAEDPDFRRVVAQGTRPTNAEVGYSVHVDVRGLRPARDHWYRFRVGDVLSPVGRTRTAPAPGAHVTAMSFAFASCASLKHGFFTPYAHLAEEDVDAVVMLGDYLYANECRTLAEFRVHHALYKSDPNLQAAHLAAPWLITIDDNDITNNWWDDPEPEQHGLLQRGLQAFWENMPLRRAARLSDGRLGLYRRLTFGDLLTVNMLDTRQYREQAAEACADAEREASGYCPAQLDERRTLLGDEQERWLLDGLSTSRTGWNVLANQVFFTQRDRDLVPGAKNRDFNLDGWDGYVADRQAVLDHLRTRGIRNTVVITGDSHQNWVLNTPADHREWSADAEPVTTEFMVTSVTSGRDRPLRQVFDPEPANTPHLLYRDASHGYARVTLSHDRWVTDYRAVSTVEAPTADVRTLVSWAVENGHPGALRL